MPLGTRIREAFLAVWKKQQLALANLTGNAFLLVAVLVVQAPVLMVVGCLFGLWLMTATLAAFQTDKAETPFVPVLRRVPQFLPWALVMAACFVLFSWLASALHFLVWVPGLAAILALVPLVSHAAGGGFSRAVAIRIVSNDQYWLTGALLVVVGLYIPFMLMSWVPVGGDFIVRSLISGTRFGISYVLAIISWLTLVSFVGRMGVEFEHGSAPEPSAPEPAL